VQRAAGRPEGERTPELSESPLESYSARSAAYARTVIGIALLALLLFGIFETAIFVQISLGPRSSRSPVALAIGAIGAGSVLLSFWALRRVRTFPLWKLAAVLLASMTCAGIGWIGVIAGAH
jgi:hypothetical protein